LIAILTYGRYNAKSIQVAICAHIEAAKTRAHVL